MSSRAILWSLVQQLGRQGTNYVVALILALLLGPKDFGVVGLATVWLAFAAVFGELGLSAAIIQRRELTSRHLSSTLFLNVGMGAGLTLLGVGLAGPVARSFSAPEAQRIAAVLSLNFVINSFSLTQVALAQRELKFRELALRDLAASLSGGVVGVAAAIRGAGVWSLVAQSLAANAVGTILIWRFVPWRPRSADVSWAAVRELWPYSSSIFSFNVFKFFAQNIDKLLIGYALGTVALGMYTFASKLVLVPVASFVGAFGAYLFPRFSRLQDNQVVVRDTFLLANRAVLTVVIPFMVIIAVAAPIIIPAMLGQKWVAAVPIIQILAPVGVIQAFNSIVGQLMKSLGRPAWLFRWSVGFTILIIVTLSVGRFWGLEGMAAGLLAAHVVGVPAVLWIARRLIPLTGRAVVRAAAPAAIAVLILGASAGLVLNAGFFEPTTKTVLGITVGTVGYTLVVWHFDRALFTRVLGAARHS